MSEKVSSQGLFCVAASIEIQAAPEIIFEFLATPSRHSLFDGSGSVLGLDQGPKRLYLNARFGMKMRILVPYRIENQVIEFVEGEKIAWRHYGRHVWSYQLEPVGDGSTRVTESFEWSQARGRFLYELLNYPKSNYQAIVKTLERLKSLCEASTIHNEV